MDFERVYLVYLAKRKTLRAILLQIDHYSDMTFVPNCLWPQSTRSRPRPTSPSAVSTGSRFLPPSSTTTIPSTNFPASSSRTSKARPPALPKMRRRPKRRRRRRMMMGFSATTPTSSFRSCRVWLRIRGIWRPKRKRRPKTSRTTKRSKIRPASTC